MRKFLVIAAMMVGSSAFAKGGAGGVYLGLNLGLATDDVSLTSSGTTVDSKSPTTVYDLDLGYTWTSGLYVGAIYDGRTTGDAVKQARSLMGVSVGYMAMNGFRIVGHYFLSGSTDNFGSVDGQKFGESTGMGVDLGYLTMVSSSFGLGFDLAYRSLDHKKASVNGVDSDTTTAKTTTYEPRISLAFMF